MKFNESYFADHMRPLTGSAIREIFKLLAKPGMISFAGGNPSMSALEPDVISELSQEVLKKHGASLLQYGATDGFGPLRESAAEFLRASSVNCDASSILPVQGGSQAFDLLLKSLINPGDVILVESPTFLGAIQAMREYNARLISMPTDSEGVIIEAAEELIKKHHPKMMYVIPTFQNPTGITLSLERRKALAALASKYGVVIAEDDPYRDLRYTGEALPAIKAFDTTDRILYCNSFSKIISPGMRVAAIVCTDPTLMRKLVIGKQSSDLHTPNLNQAVMDAYLREGILDEHIRIISESYAKQMNCMQAQLELFPKSMKFTKPEGGIFLWCELPEGFNATELLPEATQRGVAYIPGTHFYTVKDTNHNTVRLNFSNASLENIEKGMGILRDLFIEKGLK